MPGSWANGAGSIFGMKAGMTGFDGADHSSVPPAAWRGAAATVSPAPPGPPIAPNGFEAGAATVRSMPPAGAAARRRAEVGAIAEASAFQKSCASWKRPRGSRTTERAKTASSSGWKFAALDCRARALAGGSGPITTSLRSWVMVASESDAASQ